MSEIVSDAKQTLLRALDQITDAETEHDGQIRYLAVAYSVHIPPKEGDDCGATVNGWVATDDPAWLTTALLREVADAIENGIGWCPVDEDDDE